MQYNKDDDLFSNSAGTIEIRPTGFEFSSSQSIELSLGDEYLIVNFDQIDEIVSGLKQAKQLKTQN